MDFEGFLNAAAPGLYKYMMETEPQEILKIQHDKLIDQYRNYFAKWLQTILVECKSGGNVTSASFKRYRKEETPEKAIRFSTLEYKVQSDLINVPLYLAGRIKSYVN